MPDAPQTDPATPQNSPLAGNCAATPGGIDMRWDLARGVVTFEGAPMIMAWVDSTLTSMMAGLCNMVGPNRFSLALQAEGRKSIEQDWAVISARGDFREGFAAIAHIAAVAGWGRWELVEFDERARRCVFEIRDSWESRYQKSLSVDWGCALTAGKLSAYCGRLFGANCWADQVSFAARGDACDRFVVEVSDRSIEREIDALLATDSATRADMAVAMQKLRDEIAARTKAQEEIEIFRRFAETTDQGFGIATLDGTVVYVNPVLLSMTGNGALSDPAGADMSASFPPEARARLHGEILPRLREGGVWAGEIDIVDRFGAVIPTYHRFSAVRDAGGTPRHLVALITDLRGARETEKALLRSARLAAVGTLAGGVAHEFNNLLATILGHTDLALKGDPEPSALLRRLEHVRHAALRARDVARNLLSFSGQIRVERRMLRLDRELGNAVRLVEKGIRDDGAELVPHLREVPEAPLDGTQVCQVAMNLLLNAAHAVIGRAERRIGIETFHDAGTVGFRVTDTGCGIAPERIGEIFTPFYTTKGEHAGAGDAAGRSVRGTGLGLAVCHSILRAHGGSIAVESAPGRGSVFTVSFPRGEAAPPAPAAEGDSPSVPARSPRSRPAELLILEDEPEIRGLLAELVSGEGMTARSTEDGAEALRLASGGTVDLALVDLRMPKMGGADFLARLRAAGSTVPAIVITGRPADLDENDYAPLGVREVLRKPFLVEDLFAAIRRALGDGA